MSEPSPTVVQQRGLYFEELEPGVVYRHAPGRTIGEADNTQFSTLTMNPQSLHLDAAASEQTEFGKRLSSSRPGQGIVTFEHTARNQHGQVVAVVTRNTLMRCLPGDQ